MRRSGMKGAFRDVVLASEGALICVVLASAGARTVVAEQ